MPLLLIHKKHNEPCTHTHIHIQVCTYTCIHPCTYTLERKHSQPHKYTNTFEWKNSSIPHGGLGEVKANEDAWQSRRTLWITATSTPHALDILLQFYLRFPWSKNNNNDKIHEWTFLSTVNLWSTSLHRSYPLLINIHYFQQVLHEDMTQLTLKSRVEDKPWTWKSVKEQCLYPGTSSK